MKTIIIILCLTFSTLVLSQDHVSVNINIEKETCFISEPIFFEITCINSSNKPIPTYYITDYLIIQDKSGKIYHSNIEIDGPIHTIAPGDTFLYTHEILSLYGHCWLKDENDYYGLPKGTYNIFVKYSGEKFIVESNKLVINIIEPEEKERKAFKLYTKMRYMFLSSKKFNYQETIEIGISLVVRYPNSVYAPSALSLACVLEKNKTGSFKYFKQIMTQYPNNKMSASAIKYYVNLYYDFNLEKKSELKDLLFNIINKYPNTLVATEAAKQLQKLEKK